MKFSQIRGNELEELIEHIINYDLTYRETLNIEQANSFGAEIEYERAIKKIIDIYLRNYLPEWCSKVDESLVLGGEIVSPIMCDDEKYWKELKRICTFLRRMHAITTDNAAGHIHIGSQALGNSVDTWRTFVKTYAIYEDILFRFLYGEMSKGRKNIKTYAAPISKEIIRELPSIDSSQTIGDLIRCLPLSAKEKAINFTNISVYDIMKVKYKNTLEFRIPNGTINEIVWQNNINAILKLLLAQKDIDEEFLDYQLGTELMPTKITYEEICLKKALELVDLIFSSDIDKIYFLNQYLKQPKRKAKVFKI